MEVFDRSSHLPVSYEEAVAWYARPGSAQRMLPPEHSFEVLKQKCPYWKHHHQFEKNDDQKSKITDHVEYKLPGGIFSHLINMAFVEEILNKAFTYKYRTMINDLFLHSLYSEKKLKILVTGSSGFVGSNLVPFLTSGGHTVISLARRDLDESTFNIPEKFENLDAVVHLAGANIAEKRWSSKQKNLLIESRVKFTKSLCKALVTLKNPPKTMITASGIGIFGNREKDEILTEDSHIGEGFLANLAHDWELASQEAKKSGMRVVHLRFGVILSSAGGVLKKLLTPFKLGFGGPVGDGKQLMPWISLEDVLGLILFSLANESVVGAVNAVAPNIVTNEEFSKTLAGLLNKPDAFRIPETAIKLLFGEMGESLLLYSQNAKPEKALSHGYKFLHDNLNDALTYCL